MAKITRTYLLGCSFCNATGMVSNYDNFGYGMIITSMKKICPVCKGEKTVVCTETIEDDNLSMESFKKINQNNKSWKQMKELISETIILT